ncbi:MAG: hypothetical protein CMJ18_07500 [Phycisphaeraceae bacterium]|nr:hypothetical protein [Phycisphaeraceae bacterium]
MNTTALRRFREKLANDEPVYGLWITLESATITEMAVALGLDWVTIDAEHGHLDWHDVLEHVRAAVRSDTVVLVRVAQLDVGLIKRALDIGADGIVVPWIETADQLRDAVAFSRYPPDGLRGVGGERATCWGQCLPEHVEESQDVLVVPIIESVTGGRHIEQLLDVDGVDVLYFGPADYSSTAGHAGQWEGPGVAGQILAAKDAIRARGRHCGVVATDNDNLAERREQGFRMLALGLDGALLIRSIRSALDRVGRDRPIRSGFTRDRDGSDAAPMSRPPESMRPDRPEVVTARGDGRMIEIDTGVHLEMLVGGFNQARDLTTGIVTIDGDAGLQYHLHDFTESITLLSGEVTVEVEGRIYQPGPLDNLTIPPGTAHQTSNRSRTEPAVIHISMATANPTRTLVDRFFSRRTMGEDAVPPPGTERITRFRTAERYDAGPNTSCIDFFNDDLLPGLEMSGGYGVFGPQGRLPAHVHDFDESICIIRGSATCVVEGRRHALRDFATALQPRGRVHYFMNEGQDPMEMLWVYAGPKPQRLVVDERCATVEGDPWR